MPHRHSDINFNFNFNYQGIFWFNFFLGAIHTAAFALEPTTGAADAIIRKVGGYGYGQR
jgi:hypothetical protein